MTDKDIIFITEGGRGIGLGHIMHCIAIAEELKSLKIRYCFIVNKDNSVSSILKRYRFSFKEVKDLTHIGIRIVNKHVIMHSKRDLSSVIKKLQKSYCRINLIGNYTKARFLADSNIYPYEHFNPITLGYCGAKSKIYYGVKYFPLRKEFTGIKPRKRKKHILVSMGGADPNNLTELVLRALDMALPEVNFVIVIGKAFKNNIETIKRRFCLNRNFKIIKESRNFANLLNQSYLIITALGITVYEAAYLGIPPIVINNYRDDLVKSVELEKLGLCKSLGYYKDVSNKDILENVRAALSKKDLFSKDKCFDSCGAKRIISIVTEEQLC